MAAMERALISVSDKTGVVDFARALDARGVEILSTGGTASMLREAGIACRDVSDYTGFPEMMDGRVKTLNPKVHGGILADPTDPAHVADMSEHGIEPFDLVVVNLYPFAATVAKPGCTLEDAIENLDIGGPTMVRAAAKNHAHVAIVTDPAAEPTRMASTVCQKLRPNRATPSTPTKTVANSRLGDVHVQKSCSGRPCRSLSGMKPAPPGSTDR